MPITDLPTWADNLELVRLPAIESDITALQAGQVSFDSDLIAYANNWTYLLDVQNAQVDAATTTAVSAQGLAFDTSSRIYANELYVQTHVAQQIQLLRNELGITNTSFSNYLNGELLAYIQDQLAGILPSLTGVVDQNTINLATIQAQIGANITAMQAAADELMNGAIAEHDATLLALDTAVQTLETDFTQMLTGFGYETLVDGMDATKITLEDQIKSLGSHVLRPPHVSWIVDGNTNSLSPKQPAVPSWFLSNDPSFIDCIELPLGTDTYIGPAYPQDFKTSAIWEVEVRLKVSANGTGTPGSHIKIGATSFAGTVVADNAVEKFVTATPLLVANGEAVYKVRFSADLAMLTELGASVGTGAANDALHLASAAVRTKIFFYVRQNPGATTGGRLRVRSIRVTDITTAASAELFAAGAAESANAAGLSATAAFEHESLAQTYANDANAGALAAEASRLAAATSAGGSEAARAAAVIAKDGAAGFATQSQDALTLSSRVVGQAGGCLLDQFLGTTSGFIPWIATPTYAANAVWPTGRQWTFNLAANESGGIAILSNQSPNAWPGPKGALAYYLEFDFTVNSGSTLGAGAHLDWYNDVPTRFQVTKSLADMVASPIVNGQVNTARGVFTRPANFTGTFFVNRLRVLVADSGIYSPTAARNITIHRIMLRVATSEELGQGEVLANLSQVFRTGAQVDTAIATGITTYDAQIAGGLPAKIIESATALSTLEDNAAASYVLRLSAGGASAGMEMVAADDPINGPASTIKLSAKHIDIVASSVRISDNSNAYPDFDMMDPLFYSTANGAVLSLVPVADSELGRNVLKINSNAAASSVESGWFAVEPGTEYLVSGAAWIGPVGVGMGTSTLTIETGSMDSAGAVTVLTSKLIQTQTDVQFSGVVNQTSLLTGATARRARFVLTRAAGGAGAVRAGGFKVQKKMGAVHIQDGAVLANHVAALSITAEKMDVNWLRAGRLSASYLDIDTLLTLQSQAGLSYGKTSVTQDTTNGIYFGVSSGGNFGFAASRTSLTGSTQMIRLDQAGGLQIKNAKHVISGATLPTNTTVTAPTGIISLPVGTKTLTIDLMGGGAEGWTAFASNTAQTSAPGAAGGNTVVKVYDGVTLMATYTALGGTNVGNGAVKSGQNSALANGGAASAGAPATEDVTTYGIGGAGSLGSGGGGGTSTYFHEATSGTNHYWYASGRGGLAGEYVNVPAIDVSGYAAPKIEVVSVGAGGDGAGNGGAGGAGRVVYGCATTADLKADVVPLTATATGTFSKPAGGAVQSFPDLGAGFWHISTGSAGTACNMTEIYPSTSVILYATNPTCVSFFSDKTPTYLPGATARTISYTFHSMGSWGN